MTDVYCPYCDEGQEINHDDGYGYDEDAIYQQSCGDCDKVFTFKTCISFDYDVDQAPCLNGGEHDKRTNWSRHWRYCRCWCEGCGYVLQLSIADLVAEYNKRAVSKSRQQSLLFPELGF